MQSPTPFAKKILRRGLFVLAFNTLIGLGLGLRSANPLGQMVYAQAIGLCIWASIEAGCLLFPRDPETGWPTGWRLGVLLISGGVTGYVMGTAIGDLYCGCSSWAHMMHAPRIALSYMFVAAVASGSISYFFYSRGRGEDLQHLVDVARRNAAENQLKLLASQLEPHMLFNTLANLRVLIGTDPARAQLMLDHLIAFMRSTLDASRGMLHPLSAEFAHIADYLALMKIRMGERLQTHIDCPPELAASAVPPLLLQPLVENAIRHGLEPHIQGGQLRVTAHSEGGKLVLRVRDTGVGLSGVPSGSTQFGLSQVRDRLATLYGGAASVTLAPAGDAQGGTLATVRIPLSRTA